MMNLRRSLIAGILVALSAVSVASPACAEDSARFTVSGVVKALPGAGRAANEILVKHEEIPDYRDSSGKVVGMMAMTMPFYLAPDTDLAGVAVGDKVKLEVEQRFKPKFSELVLSIKKSE